MPAVSLDWDVDAHSSDTAPARAADLGRAEALRYVSLGAGALRSVSVAQTFRSPDRALRGLGAPSTLILVLAGTGLWAGRVIEHDVDLVVDESHQLDLACKVEVAFEEMQSNERLMILAGLSQDRALHDQAATTDRFALIRPPFPLPHCRGFAAVAGLLVSRAAASSRCHLWHLWHLWIVKSGREARGVTAKVVAPRPSTPPSHPTLTATRAASTTF